MNIEYRFLEPLDVLLLRGNKLFGDPGSHGEALLPPWPSLAAGALRSRMLADAGTDLADFARGQIEHPELGTPQQPGPFQTTTFQIARRWADGRVEAIYPLPADLVASKDNRKLTLSRLTPTALAPALLSSALLPLAPVLAESSRSKPVSGYWLTQAGWADYLSGRMPDAADLVPSGALWQLDFRVGVGLDPAMRRASDGRLFSLQAVAMAKPGHAIRSADADHTKAALLCDYTVGFLAGVAGAEPPATGSVRLGGDGRAAAVMKVEPALPEPDYPAIVQRGRCRLVLTTPGLFADGWLPTGCTRAEDGSLRFALAGVRARLVAAAVPRAEVISGWDLARWQPKPAGRTAPTGSVYWLDQLDTTPEALSGLVKQGLWSDPCEDVGRRAEGFNRICIAAY